MDVKEKIEATLRQWVKPDVFVSEDNLAPVAAAILAIPEIRDALATKAVVERAVAAGGGIVHSDEA